MFISILNATHGPAATLANNNRILIFSNYFPVPVNKAVRKLSRLTNSPSGFFESCTAPFKTPLFFTRNNVFDTHAVLMRSSLVFK